MGTSILPSSLWVLLIALWSPLTYNWRVWTMINLFECWQVYWSWLATSSCQQKGGNHSTFEQIEIHFNTRIWEPVGDYLPCPLLGPKLVQMSFGSRPNLYKRLLHIIHHSPGTRKNLAKGDQIVDAIGPSGLISFSIGRALPFFKRYWLRIARLPSVATALSTIKYYFWLCCSS